MLGGNVHPPALASGAAQQALPQPPTQGHPPQGQVGFISGLARHEPTCAPGHRQKDLLFPEDRRGALGTSPGILGLFACFHFCQGLGGAQTSGTSSGMGVRGT